MFQQGYLTLLYTLRKSHKHQIEYYCNLFFMIQTLKQDETELTLTTTNWVFADKN